jgi:hypothetical protein
VFFKYCKNMKNINKLFLLIFILAALSSCDRELDFYNGDETSPELLILVTDAQNSPVAGATVSIFGTSADYINEVNAIISKTSGADGSVRFTPAELGGERKEFFINIVSGAKRNWTTTSKTPFLLFNDGVTRIPISVVDVLPQFIALSGKDWYLSSYTYPGAGNIMDNPAISPPCGKDDHYRFLKTQRVIRFDKGTVCNPPIEATVSGTDWSAWSLLNNGATLRIKDFDPDYDAVGNSTLTIAADGKSFTANFGGGYVATLTLVE